MGYKEIMNYSLISFNWSKDFKYQNLSNVQANQNNLLKFIKFYMNIM
jgi:hypothetical protein